MCATCSGESLESMVRNGGGLNSKLHHSAGERCDLHSQQESCSPGYQMRVSSISMAVFVEVFVKVSLYEIPPTSTSPLLL